MKYKGWCRPGLPKPAMERSPRQPQAMASPSGILAPNWPGWMITRKSAVGTAVVIRSRPTGLARPENREARPWLRECRPLRGSGARRTRAQTAIWGGGPGFHRKIRSLMGIRRRGETGTIRPIGPQGAASPHAPGSHRRAGGPCRKPDGRARTRFAVRRGTREAAMKCLFVNTLWRGEQNLC